MNFIDMCKKRYERIKSNLCVGFDPDISKFPDKFKSMTIEESISLYFSEILLNFSKYIYVIKPNVAFYEQYGFEGLKALKNIIKVSKDLSIPVILDAKRGDIGNTAKAYALSVFGEYGADAVTLSPYLGEDSLTPFFEYKNKGFFILARTSNKSGGDFQLLKVGDKYLYMIVAEKIAEWNKKYSPSIGAVAGATSVDELKNIAGYFSANSCPPILIPGVGSQGGDLASVIEALESSGYPLYRAFINSSSKITYSHKGGADEDYLTVVENEIKKMII
ncbi:MAG: orotidine-5'-phosphate decarboxylase [Spirochaetes bacterium]|nr:orotidine-5'-phosphate decarboxylase [Spirochaetota bacterium]